MPPPANEMIFSDANRGFGFVLSETARTFRKLLDRRLQPLGLSRAQWSVLAMLTHHDGLSQSQLAALLEIEKTTTGRLIDHLQERGWTERRPIPGDRRLWSIHLTEQARPLIAEAEQIVLATRMEALDGLSPLQQKALSRSLLAVKANLSKALNVDPSGPTAEEPDILVEAPGRA